jgi:hypothetical protein
MLRRAVMMALVGLPRWPIASRNAIAELKYTVS